jgi:hypothetical protein
MNNINNINDPHYNPALITQATDNQYDDLGSITSVSTDGTHSLPDFDNISIIEEENPNGMNMSFNSITTAGTMDPNELNITANSNASDNTDMEMNSIDTNLTQQNENENENEITQGGKKKKRKTKKLTKKKNKTKKTKTKKKKTSKKKTKTKLKTKTKKNKGSKKKRKTSKTKKQKGGINRFGSGIGSNCYDPNFSIENTNLLKLFPYKPE